MFVKQIDMAKALELAAKGMEIKVLAPIGQEGGWENLVPDTLQHMLEGVMFWAGTGDGEEDPAGGDGTGRDGATRRRPCRKLKRV